MSDSTTQAPPDAGSSESPESLGYLERLQAEFLRDPAAVPPDWRARFERERARDPAGFAVAATPAPRLASRTVFDPGRGATASGEPAPGERVAELQDRVNQLVRAYRVRGHRVAAIDPLGTPRPMQPELDPVFFGLGEDDLGRSVSLLSSTGAERLPLGRLLERLRATYCRSIGVQFMHIDDIAVRRWLQERMEASENRLTLRPEEQLRIFTRLTDAVIFEEFLSRKFLGAKAFSLEGAESLIPLLDLAIEGAGQRGVDEIVLAMAHRGRLNVLANIMGKSPRRIFREFDDTDPDLQHPGGDVKYHLGYGADWTTASGRRVHLSLCFNPSHLEFINPVALGRMRAKQDRAVDRDYRRGLALLIHGDAAFAGEGVTQETLNLSLLPGYTTGGTLHVVVNNQIGFTTQPAEGRSTHYATGVARMLQVPLFHVNGEDPEACAQVVNLALDFRRAYQRDVVIDMYCYRRRGHNEGDDPSFTQPLLYRAVEQRKSVREGYLEHLLALGGITREEANGIAQTRRQHLEAELGVARSDEPVTHEVPAGPDWTRYQGGPESAVPEVATGVDRKTLAALLEAQSVLPSGFHPHPKMIKAMDHRRQMAKGERPLDWSAAESLAFASLVVAGHRVRLSGQDSVRGTFSQRHAALHDHVTGAIHVPLQHLAPDQAPFEAINSPLSEIAVLGFDYGYSLDAPDALVLWEAQYGDFVNVAQVIIDQFLAVAEEKWRRLSGLVLLLPHGFEGSGPEHSSARLERFLALAAKDNLQVVQPTTPAQYFHCLRRQVVRRWRKPLVVMTPKSLLRHPRVVSSLAELETGGFRRILPDPAAAPAEVRRVLLTSGKLYFELAAERERAGRNDVAILRLEQFYPLGDEILAEALAPYAAAVPVVWVQEEPENMGAWWYLKVRFGERLLGRPFSAAARAEAASPATGSLARHKVEQRRLIETAFGGRG